MGAEQTPEAQPIPDAEKAEQQLGKAMPAQELSDKTENIEKEQQDDYVDEVYKDYHDQPPGYYPQEYMTEMNKSLSNYKHASVNGDEAAREEAYNHIVKLYDWVQQVKRAETEPQ